MNSNFLLEEKKYMSNVEQVGIESLEQNIIVKVAISIFIRR